MINSATGLRELAYVAKVREIRPVEGKDRVECAVVNGWTIMVKKGDFKVGDLGIYFEVDSQVPEKEPFMFLAQKHFKIKIQKYGKFYSQGLLMPLSSFPELGEVEEGDFLTEKLGVTYNTLDDRKRKGQLKDKYQPMLQRYSKLFKKPIIRKIIKTKAGKEFFYQLLGKKAIKSKKFPTQFPYVKITDEERCENLPHICEDTRPWIKTLKIDGTSTTFILERKGRKRYEFYVCSRQVRQLKPSQKTYHDINVYWEMAFKYDIENVLKDILEHHPEWSYVCLQGETAGPQLQGNPHKLPERRFYGFNFIDSESGRWSTLAAKALFGRYGINWVPVIDTDYHIPNDFEEFKLSADGEIELDDASGLREGYVYRSQDGKESFKNVSRVYQVKVMGKHFN